MPYANYGMGPWPAYIGAARGALGLAHSGLSFARRFKKRRRYGTKRVPWYFSKGMAAARRQRRARRKWAGKRSARIDAARKAGRELKFKDLSISAGITDETVTDWTGSEVVPATVLCWNGVAQGDGESERIGRVIEMKSIEITGAVQVANVAAANDAIAGDVLISLVLDTQTNGAQMQGEEVYTNPLASYVSKTSVLRNMQNTDRFKVLKTIHLKREDFFMVYDGTNVDTSGMTQNFKIFVDLKGLKTHFEPGTTTGYVSTIRDNSLHVIAATNFANVTTTVLCNGRLRYYG